MLLLWTEVEVELGVTIEDDIVDDTVDFAPLL